MSEKVDKTQKKNMNTKATTAIIAIIIIIIMLIAVPLVVFRVYTNKIVNNITKTISYDYSQEINVQMTAHISSTLDYYTHELNTEYEALKLIENLDATKLQGFIANIKDDNSISYLAFIDDQGVVYEESRSYPGTMGSVSMIGQLLNGAKNIITDNVTIGNTSYIMMGTSFTPVDMGTSNVCAILLGMSDEELADHIVLHSDYSGSYSSIIHTDGSYVVKNPKETLGGLNIFSILDKNYNISDEELAEIKSAINNNKTYLYNVKENGTDEDYQYLYFAPVEGTDWYIVNTLPGAFIKNNITDLSETLLTIYVVFVVFFVLIALTVIILQTISGRRLRKSHVELENALDTAEKASRAKTDFLFSMSHDIRTPMNAILGYTDIGLRYVENPDISKDSYIKIKRAGGHLLNLINDILEMSRIESGKMELSEKPLDIREAISDVSTMSQSLAIAKSIEFTTDIGDIKNPYIYADELHINEVIVNIISNAIKYTKDGGKVRYSINQLGEAHDGKATFRFEVTDNGIGMSEEFQTHLFETFSREENTTISKTEGTGLGLSIVKRIIDMAGGEIRVHSVQNEGSTFTVDIPFRVLDEGEIEKFVAEEEKAIEFANNINFDGKKVLLVEDNELNREIATYILEDAGFEIDTAVDGEIAVNTVIEKGVDYYDFILMDIQMPVMNGYEATRKIRELQGGDRVPIIALSANAFEEDKKKSLEEGMNAHVAKPIDINVLLDTMRGLLK